MLKKTGLLTLTCFSLLQFFAIPAQSDEKIKLEPVTLMLNWASTSQHAAFAYGLEKGFYADQGIDLVVLNGKGSQFAVNAAAADQARFVWAGSDAVANSVSNNGAPVKLIGTYFVITQFGIFYRASGKIIKPIDLKGKRFPFSKLSAPSQLLPMYLETIGLKESDLTIIPFTTPQELMTLFTTQKVDLAGKTTGDMGVMTDIAKERVGFFPYSDFLPIPGDGISINTKYLKTKKDQDLNCRMIRATTRSFNAAVKNPKEAADAIPKKLPNPESGDKVEFYEQGWARTVPLVSAREGLGHPTGFTYKEDWERSLKLLEKYKLIQKIKPIDDYFTNEYMDCAAQAMK